MAGSVTVALVRMRPGALRAGMLLALRAAARSRPRADTVQPNATFTARQQAIWGAGRARQSARPGRALTQAADDVLIGCFIAKGGET